MTSLSQPDPRGRAGAPADDRFERRMRYRSNLAVFLMLFTFFYILPELATLPRFSTPPAGSLDVVVPAPPSLADVGAQLWAEKGTILNPLANPLTRFFLVTSLVGCALDRVRAARRALDEMP